MKRLFLLIIVLACVNNVAFSQKNAVGQVKTVVIDAGHGGAKPGAIGKKSQEKELTLSMALKLGKLIEDNYSDVKVIYTRTKDVDIDLAERARIANKAKADLFISIHCNSWTNSTPTGVETYVMGLSQSRANMEVAKKENADILLEEGYKDNSDYQGFDPNSPESYVMFAMYQNAYLDKSLDFAQYIQEQYKKAIKTVNRGVKQAEIFVLYKTAMPAVLTEVGFISNPEEEQYMMSDEGQAAIVVSIFNAFVSYKSATEGVKKPTNLKIDLPVSSKQKGTANEVPVADQETPAATETPAVTEATPAAPAATTPVVPPADLVVSNEETHVEPPLPKEEPLKGTTVETPAAEPSTGVDGTETEKEQDGAAQADDWQIGVVYKVQFLSSNKALKDNDREFKGLTDHEYNLQKGVYRYTTGRFRSAREALALQKTLREKGFKDAFVVAFHNGERISLQRAKELLEH